MNANQLNEFAQAQYQQIIGNYDQSLLLINKLLGEVKTFELYICRSILYQHLGNLEGAIQDSENAIIEDRTRWEGFYYKALSNFQIGNIKSALIDFENASDKVKENQVKQRIDIQVGKCKAELNNQTLVVNFAQQPAQQQSMVNEIQQQPVAKVQQPAIKFQWYQTISKIGIEIAYSLEDHKALKNKFEAQSIQISFPVKEDGSNYELNLNLFDEILPENAKVNIYLNKIEIQAEKKKKDSSWPKLEKNETQNNAGTQIGDSSLQEQTKVEEVKAFYPSSSKIKKNWDKIDKEIDGDIQKNREEYGVDPLNSLFQQIYQNSDENTRRAMVKSMQTSGGTVLSTNWDEVKEKQYEGKDRPEPPKGQEYRKWEK